MNKMTKKDYDYLRQRANALTDSLAEVQGILDKFVADDAPEQVSTESPRKVHLEDDNGIICTTSTSPHTLLTDMYELVTCRLCMSIIEYKKKQREGDEARARRVEIALFKQARSVLGALNNGTVITFTKSFGSTRLYKYAASKFGARWYITQDGDHAESRKTSLGDDALVRFICDKEVDTIKYMRSIQIMSYSNSDRIVWAN